ncbi:EscR/YscR/HrcR family type III secretion system export apparatus protein [Burkholderia ambifaria]|uniref:EscR/YscR/HrcR family type III secretion system export apparatus protein n=1 Tax=Burkholderia ambifaria TaxID=152480 RepID=UPI001591B0BD|nr:EscR/YscR/HrcR family type III secretion system export apparatus protein [Burkholderia ambifaria]
MDHNPVILALTLAFASLLPLLIASGSCFIKFSVVFSLLRNAIGLQQVPSNLVLQGLALMMTVFVMMPVFSQARQYYLEHHVSLDDPVAMEGFADEGLASYRAYLARHAEPELVTFFTKLRTAQAKTGVPGSVPAPPATPGAAAEASPPVNAEQASILCLLPAYALSELKSAFRIGFYIYLPFLVIDMLVSNILLALGMMMMSPVTIALPIKLILFVAMDGWEKVVKGLILQYVELAS